jgi:energy-coupling factor transport system ATP-binding protein
LLDEPTKGMDSFFKQKFARILRDLKARGVTVLMVSHDVEFCARHADRIGMFFDGALMSTNTPRRFFSQNSFYTTAANRMSRHLFPNAITNEDVIALCRENGLAVLPSDAAADGGRR